MNPIPISSKLHNSAAVKLRPDDGAMRAWEMGAVPPKRPDRGPRPLFEKIQFIKASRFDTRYPGRDRDPERDKAAKRERRRKIDSRMYGSWSDLPPQLRFHYSEKERAALHVVVTQVLKHGFCDKSLQEIADLAGVSRSTAKNALTEARKLGHIGVTYRPRKGLNHLPSIITIVSKEWIDWLTKRSLAGKSMSAIKNSGNKQQRKVVDAPSQGAFEREKAAMPKAGTCAGANVGGHMCTPGNIPVADLGKPQRGCKFARAQTVLAADRFRLTD